MTKQTVKGLIAGVLAGAVTICSLPVVAESFEAVMNSVNIRLNGEKVASVDETYTLQNGTKVPYSILYEGTTYLPIRKVSELLEIDIDWENDTRTVIIDDSGKQGSSVNGYDSWYGAPNFGTVNGLKELNQTASVRSTTHWYDVNTVTDDHVNKYIEQLESKGYTRVQKGDIRPKFKVYRKGTIEVWMDLGMYKKLVYGVTVMDTSRPFCSREYSYSGTREDIPNFASAFGLDVNIIGGNHYSIGDWYLWGCLPDYFAILEEEGFKITNIDSGFYGKAYTLKKDRSTLSIKYDGSELSSLPAVVLDY